MLGRNSLHHRQARGTLPPCTVNPEARGASFDHPCTWHGDRTGTPPADPVRQLPASRLDGAERVDGALRAHGHTRSRQHGDSPGRFVHFRLLLRWLGGVQLAHEDAHDDGKHHEQEGRKADQREVRRPAPDMGPVLLLQGPGVIGRRHRRGGDRLQAQGICRRGFARAPGSGLRLHAQEALEQCHVADASAFGRWPPSWHGRAGIPSAQGAPWATDDQQRSDAKPGMSAAEHW
mmetsp:Transcript_164/g.506  ORF Transcript_164/g.506 Transcript_164/m.506 type:complete len:233 (-) Transcript_164:133-831(-)